jgi:hypothetical protein
MKGNFVKRAMVIIFLTLAEAFVITKYWVWFIVPISGINTINIYSALGLGILAKVLIGKPYLTQYNEEYDNLPWWSALTALSLIYATVLIIGYWISLNV